MTPEHLRATLENAVRLSVRSGMQHRRRTDVSRLQLTCVEFTRAMVDPVIEALIEETTEAALVEACRPYGDGTTLPPTASPLWVVFLAGALCTLDQLGDALGVSHIDLPDHRAATAEDMPDLVRMQVVQVLQTAGMLDEARHSNARDLAHDSAAGLEAERSTNVDCGVSSSAPKLLG